MKELYRIKAASSRKENIIVLNQFRITLLTPSLVRLETSEKGCFTDEATQKIWNRDLGPVDFKKTLSESEILIETSELIVRCKDVYSMPCSLRDSVEITLKNPACRTTWHHGDKIKTLKGTARTLDNANGAIQLEEGIISRSGLSVLDDSKSYLINEDETLRAREDFDGTDIYFFGYAHDYKQALKDFLILTGRPPLLPRWALGNWWSRYHRYTQKEYLDLMKEFEKQEIPLSVAMIDMDWHLTQIDREIGSGWTGYSWNNELIPNPKEFLAELHKRNLKVSLNVHPAEGVGRHEEYYHKMKKALNLKDDGQSIPFDITNPKFVEAYFECLHYPREEEGVDFWWIDWQQGETTNLKNLDPLWLLNHYHFLDNAKASGRPLILSRYSGEGSHRYPVGFSGDTVISWESLAFQPYFTATASNVAYCWWSHDIGGHMLGSYDEELQVRWVQYGVFSPIMRLHSSASEFNHKEPWRFGETEASIIKRFLSLRHALIPYLYTMNVRFSCDFELPLRPLYHDYPDEDEAYCFPNEYFFGSQLISCPITSPVNKDLQMASVKVWIPEGSYTDLFTGITYSGKKKLTMYRSLKDFPLLLKAGGILPLASKNEIKDSAISLPKELELYVALGAKGSFTLIEDDGESQSLSEANSVQTKFEITEDGKFSVYSPDGNKNLLPKDRKCTIHFLNCDEVLEVNLDAGKKMAANDYKYDSLRRELTLSISVPESGMDSVSLSTRKNADADRKMILSRCFDLLDKAKIDFLRKEKIFSIIEKNENAAEICQKLLFEQESSEFIEAIMERICNI
ncbi:TIM-barrel domain-containing protein [uncultured Treponema sp.]|uniref:glycoside hydrolase family 31 protein n=1 Tax=uncultured Treponema sp. TaxID=162155 RepID=UPI0025FFAFB7|nr:TIM-barrel domain-containing protein [uncultured Treponema sp.]